MTLLGPPFPRGRLSMSMRCMPPVSRSAQISTRFGPRTSCDLRRHTSPIIARPSNSRPASGNDSTKYFSRSCISCDCKLMKGKSCCSPGSPPRNRFRSELTWTGPSSRMAQLSVPSHPVKRWRPSFNSRIKTYLSGPRTCRMAPSMFPCFSFLGVLAGYSSMTWMV